MDCGSSTSQSKAGHNLVWAGLKVQAQETVTNRNIPCFFKFGFFFDPPQPEIRLFPVGGNESIAQASKRSLTLKPLTSLMVFIIESMGVEN